MDGRGAELALGSLAAVEALAEEVLAGKQQIVDLDHKRNRNREALRALSKELACSDEVMVCFGNMFVQLPKTKTKDMLQRDQELLDEEIARLRKELQVKVSHLLETQGNDLSLHLSKQSCLLEQGCNHGDGKPELKGYNLKPLSSEEMWFIKKVLEG